MKQLSPQLLIAACGMNCRVCYAFQREKNKCPGCRANDKDKPISRVICKIKTCEEFSKQRIDFCGQCNLFPCRNLKNLDKRYSSKYFMSMIQNLEKINALSLAEFAELESAKWKCSNCSGCLCAHKKECPSCGLALSQHFSSGW